MTMLLCGLVSLAMLVQTAVPDQPTTRRAGARAARFAKTMRSANPLKVGQTAPNFKLSTTDGKRTVELAGFKGNQPVVLIFGSYT